MLTAEDNRRYEAIARAKLGPDCAHWLATGEMAMPPAMPAPPRFARAA